MPTSRTKSRQNGRAHTLEQLSNILNMECFSGALREGWPPRGRAPPAGHHRLGVRAPRRVRPPPGGRRGLPGQDQERAHRRRRAVGPEDGQRGGRSILSHHGIRQQVLERDSPHVCHIRLANKLYMYLHIKLANVTPGPPTLRRPLPTWRSG